MEFGVAGGRDGHVLQDRRLRAISGEGVALEDGEGDAGGDDGAGAGGEPPVEEGDGAELHGASHPDLLLPEGGLEGGPVALVELLGAAGVGVEALEEEVLDEAHRGERGAAGVEGLDDGLGVFLGVEADGDEDEALGDDATQDGGPALEVGPSAAPVGAGAVGSAVGFGTIGFGEPGGDGLTEVGVGPGEGGVACGGAVDAAGR
ncbi:MULTISPECIES: hypothetical protein [Actinomyces]|uniref:Uncharacterized protein n=1 Tax=Actinomyces respiraculi TaxID=2744574 RepID=A0A7T0LLC3_9ACTO|nr:MULTISPECIES: hypothetical protein [Actinomyces]QPL05561.1 hypothetical protein ID810_00760 [Actinomyces respiraculi]